MQLTKFLAGKTFDKVKQTSAISLLLFLRPASKILNYI
jgi:hypothetical protein